MLQSLNVKSGIEWLLSHGGGFVRSHFSTWNASLRTSIIVSPKQHASSFLDDLQASALHRVVMYLDTPIALDTSLVFTFLQFK